jgi:hypothetical protein
LTWGWGLRGTGIVGKPQTFVPSVGHISIALICKLKRFEVFMVVNIRIVIFWVMMAFYNLVGVYQCSSEPEDGGIVCLQDVDTHLPDNGILPHTRSQLLAFLDMYTVIE